MNNINTNSTKRTDIYSVDPRNVVVVDNFNVRRDFSTEPEKEPQSEDLSLMMKQFQELKVKHPGATLLFRCGDFFETYQEDAEAIANRLGITLTKKDGIKMAGFPHYVLDEYLPKLIRYGMRIVICDHIEDPKTTQELAKRGITEIVSSDNDAE